MVYCVVSSEQNSVSYRAAVPNLFGTRNQFHGRQFFFFPRTAWGRGDDSSPLHLFFTLFLLLLHQLHLRSSGVISQRLGTPDLKNCLPDYKWVIIVKIPIRVALLLFLSYGSVPGASMRNSACGKGHEEGGLAYAKAGWSLRSPPGNSRASIPKTRVCLLYCFVLSPTPLTLRGAVLGVTRVF